MASTMNSAASAVAQKMTMQAHPEVSVTLVCGIAADLGMRVLAVKTPEIAQAWAGAEGQLAILIGAIGGYLTRRSGK